MDAQNHSHELPAPSRGGIDIYAPNDRQEIVKNKEINQVVSPEKELQSTQPSTSQPVDDTATQKPVVAPPSNTQPTSTVSTTTSITAGDVDVIEKEWVTKAKDVIEATRSNPSEQSIQLAKVKSQYLKTRFNKEIKTPEEKK